MTEYEFIVNGRHLGSAPFFSKNIVSDISCEPGVGAIIRLDDKENLAWWLSIYLTKEQLQQILKEIE